MGGTLIGARPDVRSNVSSEGMTLCDRDILIQTAIVGAAALEDLRVDPATHVRSDWGEVTLVDCYKGDDASGYTACADQADADANATLTVLQYQADDGAGTPIPYDLRGGALYVDAALAAPKQAHQVYCLAAPDIPAAMGGQLRFFDGYLMGQEGGWIEAINPTSMLLDPAAAAAATIVRVWIYYPAGAKQSHILRLVTYR